MLYPYRQALPPCQLCSLLLQAPHPPWVCFLLPPSSAPGPSCSRLASIDIHWTGTVANLSFTLSLEMTIALSGLSIFAPENSLPALLDLSHLDPSGGEEGHLLVPVVNDLPKVTSASQQTFPKSMNRCSHGPAVPSSTCLWVNIGKLFLNFDRFM